MRKVKLTELYNIEEGNIVGNPELSTSGSLTHGSGEYNPNSTSNMNSDGPSGPVG